MTRTIQYSLIILLALTVLGIAAVHRQLRALDKPFFIECIHGHPAPNRSRCVMTIDQAPLPEAAPAPQAHPGEQEALTPGIEYAL